jgi:hypothetical protein
LRSPRRRLAPPARAGQSPNHYAGFHLQQGFNLAWGDTQKSSYGVLGLTSSPGMFGKL